MFHHARLYLGRGTHHVKQLATIPSTTCVAMPGPRLRDGIAEIILGNFSP